MVDPRRQLWPVPRLGEEDANKRVGGKTRGMLIRHALDVLSGREGRGSTRESVVWGWGGGRVR